MSETLTVACLGAGYFSRFHRDAWQRIDGYQMVGISDRAQKWGSDTGLPTFPDLQAMLAVTRPDIPDIVIPPAGHLEAIQTALKAGVKAIICQKPFWASLPEAREAAAQAQAAGTPLIIHENFRFQPWFRAIRAALDAGALGTVLQATFRMRTGDGQGPDAYCDCQPYFRQTPRLLIHETGIHYIDTFCLLIWHPDRRLCRFTPLQSGDRGRRCGPGDFHPCLCAALVYDGNRLLDHATDNTRLTLGEALIEGTEAALSLTGGGAVQIRQFGGKTRGFLLHPVQYSGFAGDCVHALQQHVVSGLRNGTGFENLAQDYLHVMDLEELICRSDAEGRKLEYSDAGNVAETQGQI